MGTQKEKTNPIVMKDKTTKKFKTLLEVKLERFILQAF
ncbi:hypothetical protein OUQ_0149 [Helicobacter pylori R055a]|nr:hypothetical protein OUQ_0149 [Helicobacter pylori R055a]